MGLKVQSCKLHNNKYMISSTQITNTEIFAFIVGVWINFSIVVREKIRMLNAAGVWRSCDSPSTVGPGQSHAGGPGKIDFYSSKGHRLAYLFVFHIKFSAVWGIFV